MPVQTAVADDSRYALLIGANRGQVGETPLQYAVADVERMAQVLQTHGGFSGENMVVLREPDAARVRSALMTLNARIRNESKSGEGVLLVFYSGHADEQSVHLSRTELPWNELRDLTTGSAAATRLLIVDACRSGAATRVKGLQLEQPFALPTGSAMPDGIAILSSAAAGEFAQESDTIGSSFFTFHLVGALQGLADKDADGAVTLAEAFDYTSDRTVASTAATLSGIQHPTYRYDLKGRANLVLTWPGAASARSAKIKMTAPGVYLWRQGNENGRLLLEAKVGATPQLAWLPAGPYFMQRRGQDRFYQGTVALAEGQTVDTARLSLRAVAYDQLVRKGGRSASHAVGMRLGGTASLIEGYPAGVAYGIHVSRTQAALTFDAGVETVATQTQSAAVQANARQIGVFIGAGKFVDVGAFALGGGLRLGVTYVRQTFSTSREAPDRTRLAPTATMLLAASYNIWSSFYVSAEGGLTVSRFDAVDLAGDVSVRSRVLPWGAIEVGKRF